MALLEKVFERLDFSARAYDKILRVARTVADLENAKENNHNPFDDQFYSYKYNFSDDFADKHAYKWTALGGTWSAESEAYIGAGKTLANDTAFSDFTAIFTVNPTDEV